MVDKCRTFGRGITDGTSPFWLSMLGSSGVGKTHCAKRLWRGLKGKFNYGRFTYYEHFIYWPTLIDDLRERVKQSQSLQPFREMGDWPFLVVDDIGAERDSTGFAADRLNALLSMRVGKWTVITSNLDLAGLSQIDDRIASRIIREKGNLMIELNTTDYGLRADMARLNQQKAQAV